MPRSDGDGGACECCVVTCNPTALRPHMSRMLDALAGMGGQGVIAFQEHAVPEHQRQALKRIAKAKGATLLLTPTDPNAGKPAGGVGFLATERCTIRELRP
eukprot:2574107-Alexandrium_andersonii.AAC.1